MNDKFDAIFLISALNRIAKSQYPTDYKTLFL